MKTTARTMQKGFTLIELLVVIGILAVLLAITLIAINPARQFSQANNTQRRSNVGTILNAIDQYAVENHGQLPPGLTSGNCPTSAPCEMTSTTGTGNIDICSTLVTKYVAALPVDPQTNNNTPIDNCAVTGGYDTRYKVSVSANDNRVTVEAPDAENSESITVTR